ncbi:MAG: trimethylamine methyltransferase family protein, partial [Thermofilum sp.]|nr:trimethylamine methyltransferase family protein [Thermofilum sp.]
MARPRLLVLDRDEADAVHSDALSLLGEVGVRLESREVEKLLLDAGCTLRGGRVLVPEELVREALAKAPKRIELYDRDGRRVSTLGEGALVFNPGSAAIKLLDFG